MAFSREALTKALTAMVDFEHIPAEIQDELVNRLNSKCLERQSKGLSEVEALAHALHSIKEQVHSITAPHLSAIKPSPIGKKPVLGLVMALLHLGLYAFVAIEYVPTMKQSFTAMGMEKLPMMTEHCVAVADFTRDYWPVVALIGLGVLAMLIVQIRSPFPQWPKCRIAATITGLVFLFLTFATLFSLTLPYQHLRRTLGG